MNVDRRTDMAKLVISFRNLAKAPKSFIVSTGSSFVLAVTSYRLFLRTGCSYVPAVRSTGRSLVPAVPTYRLFLRTGCFYVPAVSTYRLFLRTGCSYVPAVSTCRLFLRAGCSYVPAVSTYRLFLRTSCSPQVRCAHQVGAPLLAATTNVVSCI